MATRRRLTIEGMFDYCHTKANTLMARSKQFLGRTPSNTYRVPVAKYQVFERKPVKIISVLLFLLFVLSPAICTGIYFSAFWKPCTKKVFFTMTNSHTCADQNFNWTSYILTGKADGWLNG